MWPAPFPTRRRSSVIGVDASLAVSLVGTLVAVLVAIAVPLWIESRRRPKLMLELGEPAIGHGGAFKFLHARIINEPLESKWLLRNTATGCRASLSFEELGTGKRPVQHAPARWAATAEPLSIFPSAGGTASSIFDITKLPQSYRFDLSPDEGGEAITVALKHEGQSSAFAFNGESYLAGAAAARYALPKFELPGDEYRLTVRVAAGGLHAERDFRLRNYGSKMDDFVLEPWT